MGINKLFDGIAKVLEQFAEELAEQRSEDSRCLMKPTKKITDFRSSRKSVIRNKIEMNTGIRLREALILTHGLPSRSLEVLFQNN